MINRVPRARRVCAAAAMALAVGSIGEQGRAQEEEVAVLGRREARPWLTLEPIQKSVELQAIYQFSSSKSGGTSTTTTTAAFQEDLNLGTHAAIIHPNFLTLNMSGAIGMHEEFLTGTAQSQQTIGMLDTYDISADILRESDLPVNVYARRSENYISQTFSGVLKEVENDYGGQISYRSQATPTWLRLYRTEIDQSDLGGALQYQSTQDNAEFHTEMAPADRQHLSLDYHFSQDSQTNSEPLTVTTLNTQTQEARLTHTWDLDADRRYNLTSRLSYTDQSGDIPDNRLNLSEGLSLRHTDYFETFYNYTLDQEETAVDSMLTQTGQAGFTHRLYESLVTSGQIGYTMIETASGLNEQIATGNLGFNYTKKVPLGRLSAHLSLGYGTDNSEGTASPIEVLNESHVFQDPMPITPNQLSVNPDSIIVTDASGRRRFIRDVDYTVDTSTGRVQIRRTITGAIGFNDPVLLDYQVLPQPPHTTDTSTFGTGARYAFTEGWLDGLSPYLNYFQQDQSISSDIPTILTAETIRDTTVGADYQIWKITLNLELENHESNITPYNATRFRATYLDRLSQRLSYSLNLNYTILQYPGVDTPLFRQVSNESDVLSFSGSLNYAITRNLQARATFLFRDERDQLFGQILGFEEQAELRWTHRQTHVFLMLRNAMLNTNGSDTLSVVLQMGIRRDF